MEKLQKKKKKRIRLRKTQELFRKMKGNKKEKRKTKQLQD